MLIDSHAHLTDPCLAPDVDDVLTRATAAGVGHVVTIGTDLEDSRAAVALAADRERVYASAGVHPHAASEASPETLAAIEELAGSPEVVAVGETGLDYHYDNSPREAQRAAFLWHLDLGRRLGLPVVVHAREADEDVISVLREGGAGTRGVLHCFASGAGLMETALSMGWYVSFAGMITFPRYADAELLRAVPADRLLVETDSPYLTPAPHRGKRNEPAHVALVARRAAELRGEDPEELAATTTRNARTLYRIS